MPEERLNEADFRRGTPFITLVSLFVSLGRGLATFGGNLPQNLLNTVFDGANVVGRITFPTELNPDAWHESYLLLKRDFLDEFAPHVPEIQMISDAASTLVNYLYVEIQAKVNDLNAKLVIFARRRDNQSLRNLKQSGANVLTLADLLAQICLEFEEYRLNGDAGLLLNLLENLDANYEDQAYNPGPMISLYQVLEAPNL